MIPPRDASDPRQTIRPDGEAPGHVAEGVDATGTVLLEPESDRRARDRTDPSAEPPPTIEGYEILDEIGRGRMGVVYRARQKDLEREVAVKHAAMRRGHPGDRLGFLSEALVTGLLDHPNVIPAYDLARDSRGTPALAMKLVGGCTWAELLRRDPPLAFERHAEIFLAVANAVAFAHSKGIIHRDLKPENVMVGHYGEVLVMDWGLAVSVSDAGAASSAAPPSGWRTPSSAHVTMPEGTPAYMAPEMAEGRGVTFSPATDVYCLGAILYELVSGRPPHLRDTIEESLAAAMRAERPPLPPETPSELAAIVARAMAPRAEDRFASVIEMSDALRAFLSHRESLAISTRAAAQLEEIEQRILASKGRSDGERARMHLYSQISEVVGGFRQARLLWPGSTAAVHGEHRARLLATRTALEQGDLALAQSLIDEVEGPDTERLREELAAAQAKRARDQRLGQALRRSRAAAAVVILALLLSAGFLLYSVRQVGDDIADERAAVLATEGREDLRRFALSSADALALTRTKGELALRSFALEIERQLALHRDQPLEPARPIVLSENIDRGVDLPPGLRDDPAYRRIEDGREVASPVTFEALSFVVPPGHEGAVADQDIARMQRVLPLLRWLHRLRIQSVIRYFAAFDGTHVYAQFPGSGHLPADYDPLERDWYRLGWDADALRTTLPYLDQSTNRPVLSAVIPFSGPDGKRLGVAGVDVDVASLLRAREPDTEWAGDQRIYLVETVRDGVNGMRLHPFLEVSTTKGKTMVSSRADLAIADPKARAELMRKVSARESAVVRVQAPGEDDDASYWAFAPLRNPASGVLVVVPEARVMDPAQELRDAMQGRTRRELATAAASAGAALAAILALIWLGTRLMR